MTHTIALKNLHCFFWGWWHSKNYIYHQNIFHNNLKKKSFKHFFENVFKICTKFLQDLDYIAEHSIKRLQNFLTILPKPFQQLPKIIRILPNVLLNLLKTVKFLFQNSHDFLKIFQKISTFSKVFKNFLKKDQYFKKNIF